jgi:hypothetical protein
MDDGGADHAREPFCRLDTYRDIEVPRLPTGVRRLLQKLVDTLKEYKFGGAAPDKTTRSLQEQGWLAQPLGRNIGWHSGKQFGN